MYMSIAVKTEWINDKQGKGLLDLAEGSLTEYGSPITVEVTEPLRFLLFFIGMCRRAISVIRFRSTPSPSGFLHFQKFGLNAEQQAEPNIVADLLDEIEEEKL